MKEIVLKIGFRLWLGFGSGSWNMSATVLFGEGANVVQSSYSRCLRYGRRACKSIGRTNVATRP